MLADICLSVFEVRSMYIHESMGENVPRCCTGRMEGLVDGISVFGSRRILGRLEPSACNSGSV